MRVRFQWDGEAMWPLIPAVADREYVIGQRYVLEEAKDRSRESHNQYFAVLHEMWLNLPESQTERFATEEHMRKFALIKCGYADERSLVCSSKAEAQRFAAFVSPIDYFSVVSVTGCCVRIFTARSQSMKAMGKKDFQSSKQAVLEYCASLCGLRAEEFINNYRKVA